jgi:glycosyltransferase involved in cell wall biosynthesis
MAMRVLFLQQQPCVRALKYAVALRAARPDIRLAFAYRGVTLSGLYASGDELFERWYRLRNGLEHDLRRAVSEFRPDVIHSHNLPDALTVLALEITDGRIPIVHDVHDFQSLRRTPYEDGFSEPRDASALEKRAVEASAALVTVSDELLAEIGVRHRLPARVLTFPNYALRRDLPCEVPAPDRPRNGALRLVYQGTLAVNDGHYDLRELFATITAAKVKLDVYPTRPIPHYRGLGLDIRRKLPPARLLAALPAYDFGWAGFNTALNGAHLDTALPNKVFEYIGCGLPVLALPHKALARVVDAHGFGVVLDGLGNLAEQLDALDLVKLRRQVAKIRFDFTVEARIGQMVNLYESVVAV